MLDLIHTTFSTTLPENRPLKRLLNIQNAINGEVEITEESTLKNVKIKVIFHANIKYQDQGKCPHIHIDSEMFDAIKTRDYKNNKGNRGGSMHF
jgi:hypothetical protein